MKLFAWLQKRQTPNEIEIQRHTENKWRLAWLRWEKRWGSRGPRLVKMGD